MNMLEESAQVAIDESYGMREAIEAQASEVEAFHALLDLIAPANQSEAIKLIVTLKRSHYKVETYVSEAYRGRTTDEGDYIREKMMDEWRKVIGLTA